MRYAGGKRVKTKMAGGKRVKMMNAGGAVKIIKGPNS